ncbi:MAG: BRCT domain-containing protein, partial [Bacteroidota bacterium]|nr:BRCT domain-containing protein [Bacteroidota bacterium]
HSRDEIKQIITLNGGQIVSSVSAQTNLIVAGDNMGPSKLAKAKSLDIEILTEPEFLTQLGLDQNSSTENSTGQVSLF